MKKFIAKSLFVAIFMAASMSISVASYQAENPSNVTIISQGNLKFLISNYNYLKEVTVNIYDGEKNLLIQEPLKFKKLFNMGNLLDGLYTIEVLDLKKNVITRKSFSIKTETTRDIIAKN
jgi:hypothetical protein